MFGQVDGNAVGELLGRALGFFDRFPFGDVLGASKALGLELGDRLGLLLVELMVVPLERYWGVCMGTLLGRNLG